MRGPCSLEFNYTITNFVAFVSEKVNLKRHCVHFFKEDIKIFHSVAFMTINTDCVH